MYLYNISIIVEENSHKELLSWIESEWFPHIGSNAKFLKLLNSPHEGYTYCIQMKVHHESEIQEFNGTHLQTLQAHISQHHSEKAFLFDSIMQYLVD